jgi:hypothetical protein
VRTRAQKACSIAGGLRHADDTPRASLGLTARGRHPFRPLPTGAVRGLDRDANPSPISWGRGSHSERLAEGEGFEPSVGHLMPGNEAPAGGLADAYLAEHDE